MSLVTEKESGPCCRGDKGGFHSACRAQTGQLAPRLASLLTGGKSCAVQHHCPASAGLFFACLSLLLCHLYVRCHLNTMLCFRWYPSLKRVGLAEVLLVCFPLCIEFGHIFLMYAFCFCLLDEFKEHCGKYKTLYLWYSVAATYMLPGKYVQILLSLLQPRLFYFCDLSTNNQ